LRGSPVTVVLARHGCGIRASRPPKIHIHHAETVTEAE